MLICFTGLHAGGKSFFINNILSLYGFKIYDKKKIVQELYYEETGKIDDNWRKWFGQKFESDPEKIISEILDCMPLEETVILDAVHSNYEWEIIHKMIPNSYLALLITPLDVRQERWIKREGNGRDLADADKSRIVYWHNPKAESNCLTTQSSWAFNGLASIELNIKSFNEFYNYCLENEKNIKDVKVLKR